MFYFAIMSSGHFKAMVLCANTAYLLRFLTGFPTEPHHPLDFGKYNASWPYFAL